MHVDPKISELDPMLPNVRHYILQAAALAGLAALVIGLSGCATAGPNHVYVTATGDSVVHDLSATGRTTLPALAENEQVLGLAYDFNTDHLFLRLVPAQIIRVIERPSGKVLREMRLPADLQTDHPADLAIRSSDRHLFAVHPDRRSVVELTLFAEPLRRIELPAIAANIGGLAYDQRDNRLLVLTAASPARVAAIGPAGHVTHWVTLAEAVAPDSLGFDSEGRRYYVPLADGRALGEFDEAGRLVARHELPGGAPLTGIDAGQRSFVRVF